MKHLHPLTHEEFLAWARTHVAARAAELVESGQAVEQATASVRRELRSALPDDEVTARMRIVAITDEDGATVGTLWVGPHPRVSDAAFVYDVLINEGNRGKGYGRLAMHFAEEVARDEGWTRIGLRVRGDNSPARALYHSLAYKETDVEMLKDLP